jgi:nitrile hydratase accessory protein
MTTCKLPSDISEIAGLSETTIFAAPNVFSAPWEAQAFAMAVALHTKGLFTWTEWAEALSDEIRRAQKYGDPDTGSTYYHHWLAALEKLVIGKGVTSAGMLSVLRDQWDVAARETEHGEPVLLSPSTLGHVVFE